MCVCVCVCVCGALVECYRQGKTEILLKKIVHATSAPHPTWSGLGLTFTARASYRLGR